jgi:hypothetical protein
MENKKKTENQKKAVSGRKHSTDVKNKIDSSKNPNQKKKL